MKASHKKLSRDNPRGLLDHAAVVGKGSKPRTKFDAKWRANYDAIKWTK